MVLLATLAAAILALLVIGFLFERWAEARQARRHPAPGRLVEVAPGRRLHLRERGDAPGPTVVIEQGAGGGSAFWWALQDEAARFTRVVTYDRAGYGWSDAAPRPRDMPARVEDLRRLLAAANIPGPYVLVGHSYGGPLISLYAATHPDQVAGLVFADTPDMEEMLGPDYAVVTRKAHMPMLRLMVALTRFGLLRLMPGGSRMVPPKVNAEGRAALKATRRTASFEASVDDIRSIWTTPQSLRTPLAPGALTPKPVGVISHDEMFPGFFARLETGFPAGQARLAALSSNSLSVTANAGHMVQLDAPEVVADVIRRVHAAARDGTSMVEAEPLRAAG